MYGIPLEHWRALQVFWKSLGCKVSKKGEALPGNKKDRTKMILLASGLGFWGSWLYTNIVKYTYDVDQNFGFRIFSQCTCECETYSVRDIFTNLTVLTYTRLLERNMTS